MIEFNENFWVGLLIGCIITMLVFIWFIVKIKAKQKKQLEKQDAFLKSQIYQLITKELHYYYKELCGEISKLALDYSEKSEKIAFLREFLQRFTFIEFLKNYHIEQCIIASSYGFLNRGEAIRSTVEQAFFTERIFNNLSALEVFNDLKEQIKLINERVAEIKKAYSDFLLYEETNPKTELSDKQLDVIARTKYLLTEGLCLEGYESLFENLTIDEQATFVALLLGDWDCFYALDDVL